MITIKAPLFDRTCHGTYWEGSDPIIVDLLSSLMDNVGSVDAHLHLTEKEAIRVAKLLFPNCEIELIEFHYPLPDGAVE